MAVFVFCVRRQLWALGDFPTPMLPCVTGSRCSASGTIQDLVTVPEVHIQPSHVAGLQLFTEELLLGKVKEKNP